MRSADDNDATFDDSMKINIMPTVKRSSSSHNLRHRGGTGSRSEYGPQRHSVISDSGNMDAVSMPKKERPRSTEFKRSNIDIMVYQKLTNEDIDLTAATFTDQVHIHSID